MPDTSRFQFIRKSNAVGEIIYAPYLNFSLSNGQTSILGSGLLDTGASVNVLPYEIGVQLGLNWEDYRTSVILTGNLAKFPARGVILSLTVDRFEPVTMAFAWTQTQGAPLILGRVNFFQEFDVCFYGSQLAFEISPKSIDAQSSVGDIARDREL